MIKNGYTILQSNEVNGVRKIYLKFNTFFNKEDDIKNHRIYPLHFVKKNVLMIFLTYKKGDTTMNKRQAKKFRKNNMKNG